MTIKELANRFISGRKINTINDYIVTDDIWHIAGKARKCRTWYNEGTPIACIYTNDEQIFCLYIPDSKYGYINLTKPVRTEWSYYNRRQEVYFIALATGATGYIMFN